MVEQWKKSHPLLKGTNGTWHVEMFDYEQIWDEKEGRYLSDEEYFAKNPLPKLEDFITEKNTAKISDEQISEMAEMLDTGYHVCYVNPDTGEVEIIFTNEMLREYGISWDDDEEDEDGGDEESTHGWQDEFNADVKAQMARIYSWQHFVRIEKPESHEAFGFMENFVDEVIPEGKLKKQFWNALSKKHPFRNFNHMVHNCEYREEWFKFKKNAMEEYVRKQINKINNKL